MTREEAIKILSELPDRILTMLLPFNINYDYKEALTMAISALAGNKGERKTNYNAILGMPEEELAQFLEDLEKFDDPNHEWKSELMPILPFEDWSSWLSREANYGKKETD